MDYLLFFVYLVLLCWLLTKIKFIRQTNLGNRAIIILFLLRVLAGLVNGWLNIHYYAISDSIGFHLQGIDEYRLLFKNPKEYLTDLFTSNYKNAYGAVFDITDSYWNNLKSNIIIKLLSLFDVVSNCNFFINILLYNFLIFFGSAALYRIFIQVFVERKNTLIITLFLLPSFIYFTSGIHREGLLFLAIAMACFNMYSILKNEINTKKVIYLALNLSLIFFIRNFVFITLVPAFITWIIAEKRQKFVLPTFLGMYVIFAVIFFSLKTVHDKLDLPQYVSARQKAFIELSPQATSALEINLLTPDLRSFLRNSPQALNHALMRPYVTEYKNFLYIPSSLEILTYEVLLLTLILFPIKKRAVCGFVYCGIFFSLSMYLIIGYTIPILGAIMRYRSIYLPFLVAPVCCLIDINKIRHTYYKYI